MQKPTSSFVSVKTRVLLIDFELPMFFCILKNKSVIFSLEEAEPVLIWAWFFCVSSEISSSFYECKNFAKFFLWIFLQMVQSAGDWKKIDYFKTLKISTFSRKLWKKWNIAWKLFSFFVWYLCSLEIKEVGKCENFPNEKKNVANPSHDLKWTFDNLTWRGYIEAKKHIWSGTGVTFCKKV